MEDDALETKQIDSKCNDDELGDKSAKNELPVKEESIVDVVGDDLSAAKNDILAESRIHPAMPAEKRKLDDQEAGGNAEPLKRQHRWKSESLKVPEIQGSNPTLTTTPKDAFQSPGLKRNFSRSDSSVSEDAPKERVAVPPSPKPPTNSLRIDRFLRPFTLKAVQELLGKTGQVTDFWMDHIKTHCYVTYSSVEEAVETRNAVYNLKWPYNGGRLLVAEFVDPQEVKIRVEAPQGPPHAPAVSVNIASPPAAITPQPSPSSHQRVSRKQLPSPPPILPPPPPLSNPLPVRERLTVPQLSEKVDPPIVTLDDLFRKTKATPWIYYLPLSEEQVALKIAARSRATER
ncbi:apoptotic chromatin condensation inducer in the nucleus-like isoform X2 [Tripterygium wilfordii]|uniref:Apoptotic chromatin condensation inducer in the nucleus-like isoform X2 n=1 Tax=Tripterygium wilfordii TaxID=458696 RepID=A0A7J7CVA0_TRIWF|nr:apoptotic chromatin condensation inducer in the nucleus-like isoform X2 [Tripterygium wilfordii]